MSKKVSSWNQYPLAHDTVILELCSLVVLFSSGKQTIVGDTSPQTRQIFISLSYA